MEKLAILSEALEQMGYDLSNLSFEDAISLKVDVERVVNSYVSEQQ